MLSLIHILPASVGVVTGDDIRERHATNMNEALNIVPGVDINTYGGCLLYTSGINKLSTYEEYSLEAKRAKLVKPVLSSYPLEKIIALKPDLVIAPDYISADVIYGLRHMGIATVVVPTPSTVDGVIQNVMELAHIIGEDEKGSFYNRKIHREIDEIKHLAESIPIEQRKTVLFVSSMDGYCLLYTSRCV